MINQISISLWELSQDEVLNLPTLTPVLVYNTWTKTYEIVYNIPGGYINLICNKVSANYYKFFCFDDPINSSFKKE